MVVSSIQTHHIGDVGAGFFRQKKVSLTYKEANFLPESKKSENVNSTRFFKEFRLCHQNT